MHQRTSSLLFILSLLVSLVPSLLAQSQSGAIVGHVTDTQKAVLQGARVTLTPNVQSAVTSAQGDFTLSGLAPGNYTVTISYIGFQPFTQQVAITQGHTISVNAALDVLSVNESVTVQAGREFGEVAAINRERTADNILQVLPSEVINSLPNTNIADALGRMPSVSLERDEGEGKYVQIRGTEPRLTNVTVNGLQLASPENIRNVKLDVIPADLVDSIEVSKTLSANQDGDAIGGSVNLVTRKATDIPYFSIMGLEGYNRVNNGRMSDQVDMTYGQRYGKTKKFGFLIGGSYDWNGRGINDIEPVPTLNPVNNVGTFNTEDIRNYLYDRTRYGIGGQIDYKLGEMSSVYFNGIFSHFRDAGQDWIYSPAVGNFVASPANTPTYSVSDNTGSVSFSDVYRKPVQQLFSTEVGTHLEKSNYTLVSNVGLSQARQTGGYSYASFSGPTDVQFAVNTGAPFVVPRFSSLNGVSIFDPTTYSLNGISLQNNHTFQRNVVGDVALTRRYTVGQKFGAWEIGLKVRDGLKNQVYHYDQENFNGNLLMSNVLSPFHPNNYYFGAYNYGPVSEYSKVLGYFYNNRSSFTPDTAGNLASAVPNDFNVSERVTAGYAMNTLWVGPVRVQTGLRVEATNDRVLGNSFDSNSDTINGPTHGSYSYINVLPSVQAQYNFNQSTDLRVGYGIGIARPNYGDLAPYQTFDPTSRFQSEGNPALKPTHAQNFDVLLEHYLNGIGLLQVGGYYKYLTDPIYSIQFVPTTGTLAGYTVQQPTNGPHAHLEGLEATWREQLTFLPPAFKGVGVSANYSYTKSRATVLQGDGTLRLDHPSLLRDAPNNWNTDVTYDRFGLSARMGLTHNDAYIWSYNYTNGAPGGLQGPNGDTYLYAHTQLDAQVSYLIPHGRGFRVLASMLDLNNEVFGFYQGSGQFPIQREYYWPTYSFGLRWTTSAEK